jgi:sec-independent protein translocase protein TatA
MEFFSPGHLIVLAIVVAVLFFGWKQLPDMARSLGRSLRIFKTEIKGMGEDDKAREAAKPAPQAIAAPAEEKPAERPVADPQAQAPAPPRPAPSPNGRAQADWGAKTD